MSASQKTNLSSSTDSLSAAGDPVDGHDPLTGMYQLSQAYEQQHAEILHSTVLNVLKSYTGWFDVFSELIQNALDALEVRAREQQGSYLPRLWITIDQRANSQRIRVVDNGVGMDMEQLKGCFTPNLSFKKNIGGLRGQKGVGATFLAYGFSHIRVETRRDGVTHAAKLVGGRSWAAGDVDVAQRPKLSRLPSFAEELAKENSGTAVEILEVGTHAQERPRSLAHYGASTPEQWQALLRVRTPLGGVYLHRPKFLPEVNIKVINESREACQLSNKLCEFFYPHEIPSIRHADLNTILDFQNKYDGSLELRAERIPGNLKGLQCIWNTWLPDDLLGEDTSRRLRNLSVEEREIVKKHNVTVYGAFVHSTDVWDIFTTKLGLLKGEKNRILKGGLQLATDSMIQGELITIPLTSAIGYQKQALALVHFDRGVSDLGRKAFQPETHALATNLAIGVVNTLTKYKSYMMEDDGATLDVSASDELFEWQTHQVAFSKNNQLKLPVNFPKSISIVAWPQQEQDVVALFHELIGAGVLSGFRFLTNSQHERYDALALLEYDDDDRFKFDHVRNPIGVSLPKFPWRTTKPRVLEYKFDLKALLDDFERDRKFANEVDIAVCWTISEGVRDRAQMTSLLVGENGVARRVFGSTHSMKPASAEKPGGKIEVICLRDLISFWNDRDSEVKSQEHLWDSGK